MLPAGALALALLVAPFSVTALASVGAPAAAFSSARADAVQLTTTWSGSRFVAGRRAQVSGSAQPAAAVRSVLLQRRTPEGWRTVRSVHPSTERYTLRVPTGWYGRFSFRVKAVAEAGTRSAYSTAKVIRVVPSYRPRGLARTHRLAASPVARWDACTVIDYRVNTDRARRGALKDVRGALRRVYRATGLRFRYRGGTNVIPRDYYNKYPKNTDLVIAWARPGQSPLLRRSGGAMGVGGAAWTTGFQSADGTPASRIDSGYVVIDSTQQGHTRAGFGKGKTRGELLMHELGHAVGLQHVGDRRQLMYPLMQSGRARWGAGDLAGLEDLGANQGCLS